MKRQVGKEQERTNRDRETRKGRDGHGGIRRIGEGQKGQRDKKSRWTGRNRKGQGMT